MPLPTDPNDAWPPDSHKPIAAEVEVAAAWYSGDEDALSGVYGRTKGSRPSEGGGLSRVASRWFWGRRAGDANTERQRLHVPAAADLAATGADLLFGEAPTFLIPEAHVEVAGDTVPPEVVEAKATEERLAELIELDGLDAKLLEGAEVCGALSGVYLRPMWEVDDTGAPVGDHPLLTVMHADQAVPEWRNGEMVAVTFWSIVKRDARGAVWRHLEHHSVDGIEHRLYVGTSTQIGDRVELDRDPSTSGLAVDDEGRVPIPEPLRGRLLCRYVPNVRPNRRHRHTPHGRADTQNCEGLMDALDETWTSWMRDLRVGQARVIVPSQFLTRGARGEGATFDFDAEVFTPLNIDPKSAESAGITPVEFEIRTEQHYRTCMALFERIVVTAGYSPQSFGMGGDGGQGQTATEVRAREGRSLRTTERKARYWRRALADVLEVLLILDAEVYGTEVTPMRPQVVFAPPEGRDVRDVASTLNLINLAQAASIERRVRMLNPEWDDAQVSAEVEAIRLEQGIGQAPDPTGGFPA